MTSPFPMDSTAVFTGHEVNSMPEPGRYRQPCMSQPSLPGPPPTLSWVPAHPFHPVLGPPVPGPATRWMCMSPVLSVALCAVLLAGSLSRRSQCSWSSWAAGSAWGCWWTCPSLPDVLSAAGWHLLARAQPVLGSPSAPSWGSSQTLAAALCVIFSVLWEAKTLLLAIDFCRLFVQASTDLLFQSKYIQMEHFHLKWQKKSPHKPRLGKVLNFLGYLKHLFTGMILEMPEK